MRQVEECFYASRKAKGTHAELPRRGWYYHKLYGLYLPTYRE